MTPLSAVFLLLFVHQIDGWNEGAVLLRDVQVLTLYRGRYTTARRSSPVLQLQCVGGSAGCSAFVLDVVQCQNRGWDGVDVQWECKADMENQFRFGRVEVTCEGYSSPNDPYILQGSCGLEYTLELTAGGRQDRGSSRFSDFASGFFNDANGPQRQSGLSGDGSSGLLVVGFLLLIAYAAYKMFLCGPAHGYHGDGVQGPDGAGYSGDAPPPPGFKPDYTNDGNPPNYGFADSYGGRHQAGFGGGVGGLGGLGGLGHGLGGGRGRGGGGGGFWSGMGAGGLMGYLFGSQRRGPSVGGSPYHRPMPAPSGGSGTRTASGFGGTKKR